MTSTDDSAGSSPTGLSKIAANENDHGEEEGITGTCSI